MTSPAFAFFRAMAFMVAGFLVWCFDFVWVVVTAVFVRVALSAPGVVVDLPHGGFHPVVEYTTAAGHVQREQLNTITWLDVGREITVLYVPDDWHRARYAEVLDLVLPPVFVAALGLVAIGAGVASLRDARPRRPASRGPGPLP